MRNTLARFEKYTEPKYHAARQADTTQHKFDLKCTYVPRVNGLIKLKALP